MQRTNSNRDPSLNPGAPATLGSSIVARYGVSPGVIAPPASVGLARNMVRFGLMRLPLVESLRARYGATAGLGIWRAVHFEWLNQAQSPSRTARRPLLAKTISAGQSSPVIHVPSSEPGPPASSAFAFPEMHNATSTPSDFSAVSADVAPSVAMQADAKNPLVQRSIPQMSRAADSDATAFAEIHNPQMQSNAKYAATAADVAGAESAELIHQRPDSPKSIVRSELVAGGIPAPAAGSGAHGAADARSNSSTQAFGTVHRTATPAAASSEAQSLTASSELQSAATSLGSQRQVASSELQPRITLRSAGTMQRRDAHEDTGPSPVEISRATTPTGESRLGASEAGASLPAALSHQVHWLESSKEPLVPTSPKVFRSPSSHSESGPDTISSSPEPDGPALLQAKPVKDDGAAAIFRTLHDTTYRANTAASLANPDLLQRTPTQSFPASASSSVGQVIPTEFTHRDATPVSAARSEAAHLEALPVPQAGAQGSSGGGSVGLPGTSVETPAISAASSKDHGSTTEFTHLGGTAHLDREIFGRVEPHASGSGVFSMSDSGARPNGTPLHLAERAVGIESSLPVGKHPEITVRASSAESSIRRSHHVTHRPHAVLGAENYLAGIDHLTLRAPRTVERQADAISDAATKDFLVSHPDLRISQSGAPAQLHRSVPEPVRPPASKGVQSEARAFRAASSQVHSPAITYRVSTASANAATATQPGAVAPSIIDPINASGASMPLRSSGSTSTSPQHSHGASSTNPSNVKKEDLNQLANRVYELLVKRLASERHRRGH